MYAVTESSRYYKVDSICASLHTCGDCSPELKRLHVPGRTSWWRSRCSNPLLVHKDHPLNITFLLVVTPTFIHIIKKLFFLLDEYY